jgi:hypothetical protein
MSSNIDERVVSMKFDNRQFESNAKQSISTLGQLKDALDFKKTQQNLAQLSDSFNGIDLSGLSNSVDMIKNRFSAMGIAGMTVIENLTNKVTNSVLNMASTLKSSLFNGGWLRASNIENARFQLQGLGISWEAIQDDLNYAVQDTAYGLDSAAKAASQLSASGITIGDNMKTALRSISGLAAMTNSTYDDIGNIYTRIAGNGRVMAVDLESFSARGINVAAALGTQLGKTEKQIRDMTSNGDIDFATFAKSMDNAYGEFAKSSNNTFDGAHSNMQFAMKKIGAEVFTPLRNNWKQNDTDLTSLFNHVRISINTTKTNLEPFLQSLITLNEKWISYVNNFIDKGGLLSLINATGNGLTGIWSIIKPIGQAFGDVFGIKTSDQLADIAKKIEEFTKKLILSDEASQRVRDTFKSIFGVAKIVLDPIVDLAKKLADIIFGISGSEKRIDQVAKAFQSFSSVVVSTVKPAFEVIASIIEKIGNWFTTPTGKTLTSGEAANKIANSIAKIADSFYKIASQVKLVDIFTAFEKVVNMILSGSILVALTKLVNIFKSLNITGMTLASMSTSLLKLAGALLLMSFALSIISDIDPGNLIKSFGAIAGLLVVMATVIAKLNKVLGKASESKGKVGLVKQALQNLGDVFSSLADAIKISSVIAIAIGVDILASAMKKISQLSDGQVVVSFGVVTALLFELVAVIKILNKTSGFSGKGIGSLILVAGSIYILVESMRKIADLSLDEIIKGLAGIGALLLELAIFCKIVNGTKMGAVGISLLAVSASLEIVFNVMKKMSGMDTQSLAKGIIGLGLVLTELAGFMAILGAIAGNSMFSSLKITLLVNSIVALGIALEIIQNVVSKLGGMSTEGIAKGLIGLGLILAEIEASYYGFSKVNPIKMLGIASTLIIFGTALSVIQNVVSNLGSLSTGDLTKGLIGLTAMLLSLVGTVKLFSMIEPSGILKASASILVLAVGIKILSDSLVALAEVDADALTAGAVVLGSLVLELTGIIYLLSGISTKGLLKSAIVFTVISSSMLIMANAFTVIAGIDIDDLKKAGAVFAISIVTILGTLVLLSASKTIAMKGALVLVAIAAALGASGAILAGALFLISLSVDAINTAVNSILDTADRIKSADLTGFDSNMKIVADGLSYFVDASREFGIKGWIGGAAIQEICSAIDMLVPSMGEMADLGKDQPRLEGLGNTLDKLSDSFGKFGDTIKGHYNIWSALTAGSLKDVANAVVTLVPCLKDLTSLDANLVKTSLETISDAFGNFGDAMGKVPWFNTADRANGIVALVGSVHTITDELPKLSGLDPKVIRSALSNIGLVYTGIGQALKETPALFTKDRADGIADVSNSLGPLADAIVKFKEISADSKDVDGTNLTKAIGVITEALSAIDGVLTPNANGNINGSTGTAGGSAYYGVQERAQGISILVGSLQNLVTGIQGIVNLNISPERFQTFMVGIGTAYTKFGEAIKDCAWLWAEGRASAIVTLVNSLDTLSSGVKRFVDSEISPTDLQDYLTEIGVAFNTFAKDINDTGYWAEGKASAISNLVDSIDPLVDGVQKLMALDNTDAISTILTSLGTAFYTFGQAIKNSGLFGFDDNAKKGQALADVANSMESLANAVVIISNVEGGVDTAQSVFDTLSSSLDELSDSIKQYNASGSSSSFDQILTDITNFIGYVSGSDLSALYSFGESINVAISTGIVQEGSMDCLHDAANLIIDNLKDSLNSRTDEYSDVGSSINTSIGKGMTDSEQTLYDAASECANKIVDAINVVGGGDTNNATFYSMGVNFTQGLANGILDETAIQNLISNSVAMANRASTATHNALDENSPSKLSNKYGRFWTVGLANGIMDVASKVTKASTYVSGNAVDAMSDSMANISSIIGDAEYSQPIITPVIDDSQIQNGMNLIDRIMGNGKTISLDPVYSKSQRLTDSVNDAIDSAYKSFELATANASANRTYSFNIPLDINGRQVAKATATYTQEELNNLTKISNRRGGMK